MPTYDYRCTACGHKTEVRQKITDASLTTCDQCGKETFQRGPGGGIGLSFKGSGFYITDYKGEKPRPSECCPCGKEKNSCSSKE